MKTLTIDEQPIHCQHCGAIYDGSVDSARRHDWRVGWTPQMPTYCPDCYDKGQKRAKRGKPQDYDEPMFDIQAPSRTQKGHSR